MLKNYKSLLKYHWPLAWYLHIFTFFYSSNIILMTHEQWKLLLRAVQGEQNIRPLTGFIVDSPWLPGWAGVSNLKYYSSEETWFETNKLAVETFPDTIFLPGFWSEFGMCTEPSAFGAKMVWSRYNLPHAEKIMNDISEVNNLKIPNPATDGLLPFVIQRLENYRQPMLDIGHQIKFAISRGPLNIASFLMGTTELMTSFMMDPENSHKLLEILTQFSINWISYQKEKFPEIEGILILDDIVGFLGEEECRQYAIPYIKRIFKSFDSSLNFFHNDAPGLISAPYLREMGVDLFNFSFEHSMKEIRELAGPEVALLGNLPPRDVLGSLSTEDVKKETKEMMKQFGSNNRVIWSCGGGMPQNVTTENIRAFIDSIDQTFREISGKSSNDIQQV